MFYIGTISVVSYYRVPVEIKIIKPTVLDTEDMEEGEEITIHTDTGTLILADILREHCSASVDMETLLKYSEYIQEASDTFNIPIGLIAGLMVAESSGVWSASSGIADGLMQVRWDIHGQNIQKAFSHIKNKDDFMKPRNNIMVGTWLLKCMADHHNGDLQKALQRYSGGAPSHYYRKINKIRSDISQVLM